MEIDDLKKRLDAYAANPNRDPKELHAMVDEFRERLAKWQKENNIPPGPPAEELIREGREERERDLDRAMGFIGDEDGDHGR